MSLREYLQQHFIDKQAFAAMAGISPARLDQLIAAQAIPAPTYSCDGSQVRSAAFGAIDMSEDLQGEYFRPECVRWAKVAYQAAVGSERAAVMAILTSELRTALQHYLKDPLLIEDKVQSLLPHFCSGTFGLCVADPSSGSGIVKKEMLQEKLTALTANGSKPSPENFNKAALLQLIDDYANSAMPFSPAEYARSSRKRLVEDLRQQLANV